jgi:hypothetical protein
MTIGIAMHIPRNRKLRQEIIEWLDARCEPSDRAAVEVQDWMYNGKVFNYSIWQGNVRDGYGESVLTFMVMIYDDVAQAEFKLAWGDALVVGAMA